MTEVPALLKQFTSRYRARLLAKTGVLLLLALGVLSALAWKLHALAAGAVWAFGLPGVLALTAVAGLGWWFRRRWLSLQRSAAYLDRTLGLQERLVTAAEFATAKQPPALYPLLVQDTAQRFSAGQARFPRPWDRTAGLLLVGFLILLLWPLHHPSLPQLAQRSSTPPVKPPQQQTPPNPQPDTKKESQQRSSSSSPSASGASSQANSAAQSNSGQQSSQSKGGGGQQQGQSSQSSSGSQGARDTGASQGTSGKTTGQGSQDRAPGTSSEQARPSSQQGAGGARAGEQGVQGGARPGENQRPSRETQGEGRQGTAGQPEARSGGQPQPQTNEASSARSQSSQQREGASGRTQENLSKRAANQQGKGEGGTTAPTQSDSSKQATGQEQGKADSRGVSPQTMASAQQLANRAGVSSSGNQEALKAEIQGLLKELSGELKDLQTQLGSSNQEPHPEAGTSTDPELYGPPTMPEQAAGAQVPIQLRTETKDTKTSRPGGGVGQASKDVSDAHPQVAAEAAQLSNTQLEEQPVSRQPVPPEYRDVFDRLHTRSAQPKETTP